MTTTRTAASRAFNALRTSPSPSRRTTSPDVRTLHSAARAPRPRLTNRAFSSTTGLRRPDDDHNKDIPPEKAGSYSRTSPDVTVRYPEDEELRPARPVSLATGGVKPTLSSFSLEGRVGVVTGGARGLGLVMGQGMVYSGMDLAIVDLNKEEAEKQAVEIVKAFEKFSPDAKKVPRVTAHYCDVGDEASVQSCIDEIVGVHGKIDGLVTSAGFTENYDAVSYPVDRMRKLWQVNVDGTYLWATGVARHLMARKAPGSIVLIGSMSGTIVNVPQPQAPYNAAKAAVRHLAASLAVEWAGHNIRCNAIMPGYFLSALTQKILDDNPVLRDKWISLIPVGKMGVPEQLMGPAVFLLSDASSYMTGAEIRVDGAYTCS